jgi:hypothetical protein
MSNSQKADPDLCRQPDADHDFEAEAQQFAKLPRRKSTGNAFFTKTFKPTLIYHFHFEASNEKNNPDLAQKFGLLAIVLRCSYCVP